MVQHDWDGQHHQFQITPVRSADGKLTKDHMNSMESQRYYNNIKDKTIHLEEKNGGILLNIKQHWLSIVTTLIIIAILLMVTFARANEGLDNYEKMN